MTNQVPARIHVLLASRARVGLVIRRGPSRLVATYLWDRDRDTFTLGQWMKGRIYERRCDLSPDGKYLLYFAMNGMWQSATKGAWSVISRAPWLRAIALFPKGDCWNGGGLWTGDRRYWLNESHGHEVLEDTHEVRQDEDYSPVGGYGNEDLAVYFPRLLRDGWEHVRDEEVGQHDHRFIWERPLHQGWVLRKIAHSQVSPAAQGRGCTWDAHQLVNERTGDLIDQPDWAWAERDGSRVVWASGGRILGGRMDRDGLTAERELIDLNEESFERVEAPYTGVQRR